MNPAVDAQSQPLPLLVWIDVETTGLDPDADCLLELAVVLTGPDLVPITEPFSTVIAPARPDAMATMGQWVRNQHSASGLLAALDNAPTLAQAESAALEYIARHVPAGTAPLAGSSVGFDRSFLTRHMPALAAHLHYRTVDVSTIRELAMRWFPAAAAGRPSRAAAAHRALPDILASIAELAYWRRTVFAGQEATDLPATDAATTPEESRAPAEHTDLDTRAVQQILAALPAVLLGLPLNRVSFLACPVEALADAANKLGDRFAGRITDLAARDGRIMNDEAS